jgi:hypothetical protein
MSIASVTAPSTVGWPYVVEPHDYCGVAPRSLPLRCGRLGRLLRFSAQPAGTSGIGSCGMPFNAASMISCHIGAGIVAPRM